MHWLNYHDLPGVEAAPHHTVGKIPPDDVEWSRLPLRKLVLEPPVHLGVYSLPQHTDVLVSGASTLLTTTGLGMDGPQRRKTSLRSFSPPSKQIARFEFTL